jgi:hypothetical protein
MESDSCENCSNRVCLKLEIRYDTEVATTAAYRPKEVAVLRGVGGYESPVSENDIC